ncbi:MAG: HD domain-containing protein [Candidatus Pacebacteria bacterium]|nr:HD domain-containing protein [Candidatus Paceibacterota bacterium]
MKKKLDLSRIITHEEIVNRNGGGFFRHGLSHRLRVLILAVLIAEEFEKAVDLESVVLAALYHDIGRKSDFDNQEHGEASARWVRENLASFHPEIGREKREKIARLCQQHSREDEPGIAADPELQVLKDADALDRVRFFVFSRLKKGFLRTAAARRILSRRIPQKLIKASGGYKCELYPEKGYQGLCRAVLKLGLPVRLPLNPLLRLTKEEIKKILNHLGKRESRAEAKKFFSPAEIELLGLWLCLRKKISARKKQRKEIIARAFEKSEICQTERKLIDLSKEIKTQQEIFTRKLDQNEGQIISTLRLLKNRFREIKKIGRLHRAFLNHHVRLAADKNQSLSNLFLKNSHLAREKINPAAYLKSKKLSRLTKLFLASCQLRKGDSCRASTAIFLINRNFLRGQPNRLAVYRLLIGLGQKKALKPEAKKHCLGLMVIKNKIAADLVVEKGIETLTEEINPYFTFFFDQQKEHQQEVVLLIRTFWYLLGPNLKFWNRQLLPILLNRSLGNLAVLKKTVKLLGSESLENKWLFLVRAELKNRRKKEPYYETIIEYIGKRSDQNYRQTMRKLGLKRISRAKVAGSDFELCINLPSDILAEIIQKEQRFFNFFNKMREEKPRAQISKLLEPVIMLPRLNSFKETAALIRQPNRSYQQPIYGYLARSSLNFPAQERYANILNKQMIRLYGSTTVILKKEVCRRTIFSLLDAVYSHREKHVAYEEAKKLRIALDKHFLKIHFKHKFFSFFVTYIEAKFLGGVGVNDFAKIRIPFLAYLKHKKILAKLKNQQPELKIEPLYPF